MRPRSPQQSIDLSGLKVSLKTFGDLTFFYNVSDGFESLSAVADRALSEWLAQQGAALRMKQIDLQFLADQHAQEEQEEEKSKPRSRKSRSKSGAKLAKVTSIDSAAAFGTR